MASDDTIDPNLAAALRLQEQFDFYLLGLTFTILGLSVQTARFDGPAPKDALELVAWWALLVSGLAALYRAQWKPNLYRVTAEQIRYQEKGWRFREAAQQGQTEIMVRDEGKSRPTEEMITNADQMVELAKTLRGRFDAAIHRAYLLQRVFLVVGFVGLLLSRGYAPLSWAVAWTLKCISV